MERGVVTVVTQTEVAADDPAFTEPTKPIGGYMDEEQARRRERDDGWRVMEDAGRGWRRVVASPVPKRIVEVDAVQALMSQGFVVITVGGGGIPVIAADDGLQGVAAVIDKDSASSLLANEIGAELFIISTSVEKVALEYGTPEQRDVDVLTLDQARGYLAEGRHFATGSMAPKIQACIWFLERGGSTALITDPDHLEAALAGETGTRIVGS
jgi:carbamate kinase